MFCDYSERAYQKEHGGQWVKGKSCDSFAPMGPVLVTPEEVADPQALRLWSRVNGELRQDGSTADMIFRVRELVSYISRFMTLAARGCDRDRHAVGGGDGAGSAALLEGGRRGGGRGRGAGGDAAGGGAGRGGLILALARRRLAG